MASKEGFKRDSEGHDPTGRRVKMSHDGRGPVREYTSNDLTEKVDMHHGTTDDRNQPLVPRRKQ